MPASAADAAPPPLVYVTNSANLGGGVATVARFRVDDAGRLDFVDRTDVGERGARSMVFTPDLRFAYLAHTGLNEVLAFAIGSDGELRPIGAVATASPYAMDISPDGRTVYASNVGTRTVSAFTVDTVDGSLTPLPPVDTGVDNTKGVAVTPDGRYLYVSHGDPADTEPSALTGFALTAGGAVGRQVAKVPIGVSGAETVITPDGQFVYVVHQVSNDVHGFRINYDGSLTPVPGSPIPTGDFAEGAEISPDGKRLYVAAVGVENGDQTFPGAVVGYAIGRDGSLTETVPRVTMTSPIGIGFSPDGQRMYVSDFTDSVVNTFAVAGNGHLSLIQTVKSGGLQPAFHSVNVLPVRSIS